MLVVVALSASTIFTNNDDTIHLSIAPPSFATEAITNPLFQLAYDQSNGFFNDIPEDEWKLLQKRHYRQFPNCGPDVQLHHDTGKDKNNHIAHRFYFNHFEPEFTCRHEARLGGLGDGPKWICDPHRISKQKDCLVYSVGSAGNILFEKTMKEEVSQNCEIHTFDVMSGNRKKGSFAERLVNYSTFHGWGLSHRRQPHRNMKTLKDTIAELGHFNRTIDIFKIDCEGCEWTTFNSWFTAGVDIRQILVETHFSPMPAIVDFFQHLHDLGYVIYHKESNYYGGGNLVEYAFVKVSTEFFLEQSLYSIHNFTCAS